MLKKVKHSLNDDDFNLVARLTAGYSGADVTVLCREAAQGPLRCAVESGNIETISESDIRGVAVSDFVDAVKIVKSSVSPDEVTHYKEFNEQFGHTSRKVEVLKKQETVNQDVKTKTECSCALVYLFMLLFLCHVLCLLLVYKLINESLI